MSAVTIGTYSDFFRALGQNESGNNYGFVSSLGYLGRFQFGEEALQAVGFYQGDQTSTIDFIGSWTQKAASYGAWDKTSFLNSPDAQNAATTAWFEKIDADLNALGLRSYEGQWIGGGQVTNSGLLAGAHLVGVWALKSFLESGGAHNTRDGYGTPVSEYVHRFGDYQTPFMASAQPSPGPVPSAGEGQVLTSSYAGAALTGGAGADTLNASQGADQLTGGAGADTFAFKATPWSAGRITDFQVGTDKLDLSRLYTNGYRGSDPVGDGYVRFTADGAGGTKVMLDVDGPAGPSGISFHIVTLQGIAPASVTATNVFGSPSPASPAPTPTPAPAPAPAPASGAGQTLTSPYPGAVLTGGAGADTLIASQGSDQLTGGGGADTFVFKMMPWSAGRITDFQVGTDKLDLSGLYTNGYRGADPVAEGYLRFTADGAGGTKVMLDVDGPTGASGISFHVVTLQGIAPAGLTAANTLGGAGSSAPAPAPAASGSVGQVLTSTYPGATLRGGSGADTLAASQGADQLIGGGGADHFTFANLPWSAGHVRDFQDGLDVLDLRPLFSAAGYRGQDPVADGYLRLQGDGAGGTTISFDADGWGSGHPWPTTVTTLDLTPPHLLGAGDWLFR
jgi:hypothetical protein